LANLFQWLCRASKQLDVLYGTPSIGIATDCLGMHAPRAGWQSLRLRAVTFPPTRLATPAHICQIPRFWKLCMDRARIRVGCTRDSDSDLSLAWQDTPWRRTAGRSCWCHMVCRVSRQRLQSKTLRTKQGISIVDEPVLFHSRQSTRSLATSSQQTV